MKYFLFNFYLIILHEMVVLITKDRNSHNVLYTYNIIQTSYRGTKNRSIFDIKYIYWEQYVIYNYKSHIIPE